MNKQIQNKILFLTDKFNHYHLYINFQKIKLLMTVGKYLHLLYLNCYGNKMKGFPFKVRDV